MDSETLNLVNAIAAVLAAVGTVAAVIVAVYLARRDEKLRLRASAHTGGIVSEYNSRFVVMIDVANIGRRPVQVTGISWRIGLLKKKHYFQKFDWSDPDCHRLPKKLKDGDQAHFVMRNDEFNEQFSKIIAELPRFEQRLASRTLRLLVHTSAGETLVFRINRTLRERITELASNVRSGRKAEVAS